MANEQGKTTPSNVHSMWAHLWGGVTLRKLRKAMGLGDTLGALPPECGGTGSTTGLDLSGVLAQVYPVGTFYTTTSSKNPKEILGFGTWTQVKDKFILAAGTTYKAGSTGGEATHKLTVNEMPSHSHDFVGREEGADYKVVPLAGRQGGYGDTTFTTSTTGSNVAHNNMPPYWAVYVWYRTA